MKLNIATKTIASVQQANADGIVDQAAKEVVELIETLREQKEKRAFSNRLVRIANSPELIQKPLSEAEDLAIKKMMEQFKGIQQRLHQRRRKEVEIEHQFEIEMQSIANQEHLVAEQKRLEAEQKFEVGRKQRAEMALVNMARRARQRQEEKLQLQRAKELVRPSRKHSDVVQCESGQTESPSKTIQSTQLGKNRDARARWKNFMRRYHNTKWSKAITKEIEQVNADRQRAQVDKVAGLVRRHDYGLRVRHNHVPEQSRRLQNQIAARIQQLRSPVYIRKPRDVRAAHQVVAGIPGTEKPVEPEPVSTARRYSNYLDDLHRIRIQNDSDEYRRMSKAALQEKIRSLEKRIQEKERTAHSPNPTLDQVADDLARLSQLYLKALRAKSHLCDVYEAEHIFTIDPIA